MANAGHTCSAFTPGPLKVPASSSWLEEASHPHLSDLGQTCSAQKVAQSEPVPGDIDKSSQLHENPDLTESRITPNHCGYP